MSLIAQLKTIPDPRNKKGQSHPLSLILFLALHGSLWGYWGYRPLAAFTRKHHPMLCDRLGLDPSRPKFPSFSTFRRAFLQVDAQAWVDALVD